MLLYLFALSCCAPLIHAAPQYSSECAEIPKNPAAGQIGAQYLEIPGCSGNSGGTSSNSNSNTNSENSNSDSNKNLNKGSNPFSAAPKSATLASKPPLAQSIQPVASTPPSTQISNNNNNNNSSSSSSTSPSSNSSSTLSTLFKSSVTRYGQGPPGTPGTDQHCQAHEGSCGNNPVSGYTAAVSQFLYFNGASPGSSPSANGSPGRACNTCWRVTGATDSSSNPLSPPAKEIVVLITNECAAQLPGQPVNLCGMGSLQETNSLGANVNVDLCMDSGAAGAFFNHDAPWGTAVGTAVQVGCDAWCGVFAGGKKSGPEGCTPGVATWADTT